MTQDSSPVTGNATLAVEPVWLRYGSVIGLPVLGGLIGWLIALTAGWVAGLRWAPFQGPFELIASLPQPAGTLGIAGFGVLAGIGFSSLMAADRLSVTVAPERVEFRRGRRAPSEVAGIEVDAAFLDRGALVLQDSAGDELAREQTGIPAATLRATFHEHGYRWLKSDPHGGEFELWVPETPAVGVRVDSLLRTRAHALKKRNDTDAAQLRDAIKRAGFLVRDEKRQQHVRPRPQRNED